MILICINWVLNQTFSSTNLSSFQDASYKWELFKSFSFFLKRSIDFAFAAFLALLCCVSFSQQLYENDVNIVVLTDQNYSEKVENSSKLWIVQFYSPNCYHSVNFVPTYRNVSIDSKNDFYVGAVECRTQRVLCRPIKYVPTIFFIDRNQKIKYDDETTAQAILQGAMNATSRFQENLNAK